MSDDPKVPGQEDERDEDQVARDGEQKPKRGRRGFLVGTLITAPAVATLGSRQSFGGWGHGKKGKKDKKKDKKKGSVSMSKLASIGKGKKNKVKMKY